MAGQRRYTEHARKRMAERLLNEDDVELAVSSPDLVTVGETAIEYDRVVTGRPLSIVAVRGSDPLLVITVMLRTAEE